MSIQSVLEHLKIYNITLWRMLFPMSWFYIDTNFSGNSPFPEFQAGAQRGHSQRKQQLLPQFGQGCGCSVFFESVFKHSSCCRAQVLQCVLQTPLLRRHLHDTCKHPPEDSWLCFLVLFLCVSTSALKIYFMLFPIRALKSLHNDSDN